MTKTEIAQRLTRLLRELKGGTPVDDPQIKDVIVDSLDMMKFVVRLEETFNVYIDEQHLGDQRMFDDAYVVEVVETCLRQAGS